MENVLSGKYYQALGAQHLRLRGKVGRIIGSPAPGWFLVAAMDEQLVFKSNQLVNIDEMVTWLFFNIPEDLKESIEASKPCIRPAGAVPVAPVVTFGGLTGAPHHPGNL